VNLMAAMDRPRERASCPFAGPKGLSENKEVVNLTFGLKRIFIRGWIRRLQKTTFVRGTRE
jgi:hypothetical protein